EIEAFIPEEFWKIGGVFSAEAAKAPKLAAEWLDYLTNTGNGERTKAERDKWLAEHGAFVAELVEVAGEKFAASDRTAARRVAEMLGFKVEKEEETADPEGKGPAAEQAKFVGQLSTALPKFIIKS